MDDREDRWLTDLTTVVAFLAWIPNKTYWGGHRVEDVRESFARLAGMPDHIYENIKNPLVNVKPVD